MFAHGALCMCYSGQCAMSAVVGGRSGNRGTCAQPCRLPYTLEGQDNRYPLSLKDNSLAQDLSGIRDVACLKLEGRMKRPEYEGKKVAAERCKASVEGRKAVAASKKAVGGMKIVSVDEAGEIPLQRVLPWEKLVDQLAASRSYMELAGQHSGLGKLFLEHQQQVIELFKQHILLYGKGGELLFLEDVRRYFSNYVAPGSTTCRMLRETLLSVLQKAGSTADNRFETLSNGRRMYLGHLIPDDAPLRPDAAAVWDDVRKKWGH